MSTHKGIFKNSEIETISSKLKFISKLKKGQKISVSTNSIQDNTYWTSLMRSMTGENREKVYNFISEVIQDSLSILDSLSNSNNEYDIRVCKNLITDLIYLTPGLKNLQETYKEDVMYVAKLITLLENLEVKIKELCDKKDIDYDEIYNDYKIKLEKEIELSNANLAAESEQTEEKKTDDKNVNDKNEDDKNVEDDKKDENKDENNEKKTMSDSNEKREEEYNDEKKTTNENDIENDNEKKTTGKTEGLHTDVKKDLDLTISSDPEDSVTLTSTTTTSSSTIINIPTLIQVEMPIPREKCNEYISHRSIESEASQTIEQERAIFRSKYLQSVPHDVLLMSTSDKSANEQILYNPYGSNNPLNRNNARKKKKKHAYQYDNYYMSTPDEIDDITLCNSDLQKGIIE